MKISAVHAAFAVLLASVWQHSQAENIDANDANEIDRFCYPQALRDSRRSCECNNVSASPWGMRALHIDCSYKEYKAEQLSELLPLYIDALDLAWNRLDRAPVFASDSLRLLNLMHNNISRVAANNFGKLLALRELYLSWNSIQVLEAGTFAGLPHLQVLDLSHNNLQTLPMAMFGPLLVLNSLDLSWNRQLNQTVDMLARNLYTSLGINSKLAKLRLDACSLRDLVLPLAAPLQELSLRRNLLTRVPQQLPQTLLRFDMSDNLLEQLQPSDTANLIHLQQLLLEDMPLLQSIAEDALRPCAALESISLQNSRHLNSIDAHAFGQNVTRWPPLSSISFRGTALRTFNVTLFPVFAQLTELDLNGAPLYCDCDLVWLKDLRKETNGRCFKPSRLRGMLVSSVRRDSFSCERWPRWAYGLIILGLIALCSAGIYLIVMGLRPHRGVTMRRKVGAGSPYARVTIEPNRQENNFN